MLNLAVSTTTGLKKQDAPITRERKSSRRVYAFAKRLIDVLMAGAALLSLSLLMLLVGLVVRLDSPGPVFYRRRVMARGGGTFDAFKFRTMVVNGEAVLAAHPELLAQLAAEHKLRRDPRITRSGHWLRRLSLDELPQLINVLRGEMSIVGPRMISPVELERYGDRGAELLSVPPGITGLWQVSGRSNLDPGSRVRLDLEYVNTCSLGLDLQLMWRTVSVVIKGTGAY